MRGRTGLDPELKLLLGIGLILMIIVLGFLILINRNSNYKYPATTMNVTNPYIAPELTGLSDWINSQPLTLAELKGKVVLIDFWTYSCINCVRTLPYVKDWYAKYQADGLVVIGVHAPEFEFERELDNVRTAVQRHGIEYPVALDNQHQTWQAFANRYWPAHYFIDKEGNIRHTHFGEGEYDQSEKVIQTLLAEGTTKSFAEVDNGGVVPFTRGQSPETYLGYERAESFINSDQAEPDTVTTFTLPQDIPEHAWAISGQWRITRESIISVGMDVELQMRFSGTELYLVMESDDGSDKPIKVFIDGVPVSEAGFAGQDVDEKSQLVVNRGELYRLVKFPEFHQGALLRLVVPAGVRMNAFTFAGQ